MDGTRSALIVASDQYTDPGLRRLRAPASDARALAAVLRDPGIGGFEVRTLLNEPAHVVNLAVEEFFADRRPGDLLLVHFSCHGIKDEDGELYFAASNTMLGRLGATAVAAEFVSRRMNRSRSRRVVLLLDCCYAGAFERGLVARAGTEMGIEQQFGGRGRAVITASSAMEYAFEAGELADTREVAPSVFTSALVEGLETGEADRDQDGLVGLDELYDYVYDKVRAATPNQTPGKWTFGVEGELYIARRSRPVTTPAPLPPELQQAIDSPLAGIRAGAVQELAGVLRGRHAGMALAARLALEQLTERRQPRGGRRGHRRARRPGAAGASPASPPELALPATVIDLGRLPLHGQSPERRVRIGNAGGGDLNARAATSASWLKLRQSGDELVVAVDTSAAGEYEGTVTVDSDGGTATIRVHARVRPAPRPATGAAAATRPYPVPIPPVHAQPGPRQDPTPRPCTSRPRGCHPAGSGDCPGPDEPDVRSRGPGARRHRPRSPATRDHAATGVLQAGRGRDERGSRPGRSGGRRNHRRDVWRRAGARRGYSFAATNDDGSRPFRPSCRRRHRSRSAADHDRGRPGHSRNSRDGQGSQRPDRNTGDGRRARQANRGTGQANGRRIWPASAGNVVTAGQSAPSDPGPADDGARPTRRSPPRLLATAMASAARRLRHHPVITSLVVLVAVIIGGVYIFWQVSQSQYYVAANSDGQVLIYRGIDYNILGINWFASTSRPGFSWSRFRRTTCRR